MHFFFLYFAVVVQSLSHVRLFATPWTAAHQAPLSCTISWSLLKFVSIESVMLSNHLILCCPLLFLPSIFPTGFFPMGQLFKSGDQVLVLSFSISPSNEYSWLISFGLISLISLWSKGFSSVFSSNTIRKHQLFGTQPSLWPNFHIHTYLLETLIYTLKVWTCI